MQYCIKQENTQSLVELTVKVTNKLTIFFNMQKYQNDNNKIRKEGYCILYVG